jgi:hypothetical protein
MQRVFALVALMLALVMVSTACSSSSVPSTTSSAQPSTVVPKVSPTTDQVRVVMTQIVSTPPPPTQPAKEFPVCTGAEGSFGWSIADADKRQPAYYFGPGTELVAENTGKSEWLMAGGYFVPAIKVVIGPCPKKIGPTPKPTSGSGVPPVVAMAVPIFKSGATDPNNAPPYKSVQYLGPWVSNARLLLQARMSPEDFQKAMKTVDEAANLAARTGSGLATSAKLLWRLIRAVKAPPMLIIMINPCAGDEPDSFDVASNRPGISVFCGQLFGIPPSPILF